MKTSTRTFKKFSQSKSEGEIRIKMENLTSIIDFAKRNEAEVQGYAAT